MKAVEIQNIYLSDIRFLEDREEDRQLTIGQIMSFFDDIVQPIENDIENGSNSHLSTFVCLSNDWVNLLSDDNRCVALDPMRYVYIYRSRSNNIYMITKRIINHKYVFEVRYCLCDNNA
jgi:hypothetical protein